jgi:hypothetical protein
MSKIFDNSVEWNNETKHITGLPRPFSIISKEFREKARDRFFIARKVPVPWQTIPKFHLEPMLFLGVVVEHEKLIYAENNICPYCGIKFDKNDQCIRWNIPVDLEDRKAALIRSDRYPFHFECMDQARKFCPHMKKTKDSEFEIGTQKELIKHTLDEVETRYSGWDV